MGIGAVSEQQGERRAGQRRLPVRRRPRSGDVVGYEAFARGPQGGDLERSDVLLSAARRAGLVEQVDWECRLVAGAGALVGVFGAGLGATPAKGVHGTDLAADDALRTQWCVALLAPHFAAALVGEDRGDEAPDPERRFRFVLTHDRELVIAVARAPVTRIA